MSFDAPLFDRRQFLSRGAMGFGGLALSSLLQQEARGASPWLPRAPHCAPKAPASSTTSSRLNEATPISTNV